jgi:hypothetical protein
MTFDKQNAQYLTHKYTLCDDERINLSAQNLSLNTEVTTLKADQVNMASVLGQYKADYIDQNAKLNTCVNAAPSRLTWFGTGALSVVIIGLLGMIAIYK